MLNVTSFALTVIIGVALLISAEAVPMQAAGPVHQIETPASPEPLVEAPASPMPLMPAPSPVALAGARLPRP